MCLFRGLFSLRIISTKVDRLPAEKAAECYVDYSTDSMRESLMRSLDLIGVEQVD